jgi:hypothetical protein
MRALAVVMTAGALAVGGCSLLFDGNDLKGKNANGDMSAGGSGGSDDMAGGGGGTAGGGGGGTANCTPTTSLNFAIKKPGTAATGPYDVAVADLDDDGKLDIVTANYNANSFSVLLGDGSGNFALAPTTPVASCDTPQLMRARDVTGDGLADVIVSCFNSSTPVAAVNVYVNQSTPGSVHFATAKALTLSNAQMNGLPYIATGNFAGDANVDIAMVDPNTTTGDTLRIYTGNGQGAFAVSATTYPTGKGGSWMTVGDLNSDSADDILVYDETDDDMTMLLSKAGGGFTSSTLAHPTAGGTLYFVNNPPSLVDVNHDGLVDILVASATTQPGTVEKFLNSGTATAPAFPTTPVDINTGDSPQAQGFADFNCDGVLDIAVSTNGCDPANVTCPGGTAQPPGMWILAGHGTGYDPAVTVGIPLGPDNIVIADFNNDGYPDIATGSSGSAVTVLIMMP